MIEFNNADVDLRNISHAKNLKELFSDETTAFVYGINHAKVINYIKNVNLRKKNYTLYSEYTSMMRISSLYKKEIQKLVENYKGDNYIEMCNEILDSINYIEPSDRIVVAYTLGNLIRYIL